MNASLPVETVLPLAIQTGTLWPRIATAVALLVLVWCHIRWIRSRRGTWLVGVGLACAWLMTGAPALAMYLLPVLGLHAVWVAYSYARQVHAPCPHHSRLPVRWRRFACGNLLRCRMCHMLYPLVILVLAIGISLLLLHAIRALAA